MPKNLIKKIIVGFVVFCVVLVFDYWLFAPKNISEPKTQSEQSNPTLPKEDSSSHSSPLKPEKQEKENTNTDKQEKEIILKPEKESFQISVPFTSQSPYKKWDHLHSEACEEASLVMAKYWLLNKKLSKEIADKEIKQSVAWQKENWGGHYDLRVKDTITLAKKFFNIKKIYFTEIESIKEIKYFLEQGKLVIAPMAGRKLDNPYFKNPGPPYHMLVATGFNKGNIITNEPGTYRGKDFAYTNNNFFNALHDWPFKIEEKNELDKDQKSEEVLNGLKRIIIIEK